MPDLSRIPQTLGTTFFDGSGREFRGTLKPPPSAGPFFDAGLAPRRSLIVNIETHLTSGAVVTDADGTRFLAAEWSPDNFFGRARTRSFVLFEITHELAWTRSTFAVEPVSGQRLATGATVLGPILCAREFIRRKNDSLDIEEEVYRVMCNEPLVIGDFLNDQRVMRSDRIMGLTYAEVF
jgi:hypothetical protein